MQKATKKAVPNYLGTALFLLHRDVLFEKALEQWVMSSYVISDTLSESKITLFGNYIYLDFSNSLWNEGSFMILCLGFVAGAIPFALKALDLLPEALEKGL